MVRGCFITFDEGFIAPQNQNHVSPAVTLWLISYRLLESYGKLFLRVSAEVTFFEELLFSLELTDFTFCAVLVKHMYRVQSR